MCPLGKPAVGSDPCPGHRRAPPVTPNARASPWLWAVSLLVTECHHGLRALACPSCVSSSRYVILSGALGSFLL